MRLAATFACHGEDIFGLCKFQADRYNGASGTGGGAGDRG